MKLYWKQEKDKEIITHIKTNVLVYDTEIWYGLLFGTWQKFPFQDWIDAVIEPWKRELSLMTKKLLQAKWLINAKKKHLSKDLQKA